jgi:hypothetical protein
VSALADLDRDGLWSAVDELVDRAPGPGDLRAHGLHLLAGARLRSLGQPVPDEVAAEERLAAVLALAVPTLLQRARAAYDGRLMIMKGAELAQLYRDPSLRAFYDVDLLADDAEAAQRALVAAGFQELGTDVNDIGIHLCPLGWPGLPVRIELHRRPRWVDGLGNPSLEEIFEAAEPSALGVPGILAPARHHHALLLAGHAWTHEPLRRVSELIDIAVVTHGTDRADVRSVARRWGCERLWHTTERAVDAVLYGARSPVPLRTWARHLRGARERTVLETRLLRIAGPVWGMPLRRVPRELLRAIARLVQRHDGERWRAKIARVGRLARTAARPRSELRELGPTLPERHR